VYHVVSLGPSLAALVKKDVWQDCIIGKDTTCTRGTPKGL